jgi:hypothetical protein
MVCHKQRFKLMLTWVGDDICKVSRGWGVLHGDWLLRHGSKLPQALVIRALEVPHDPHATLRGLLSMAGYESMLLLLLLHSRARHQARRPHETHGCSKR